MVAVILHELSHGVAAYCFGDDTAKRAGRLTLNPIPHIDPLGSVILPTLAAVVGLPLFGWAKPVPVAGSKLRRPRRDLLFVSLAGPASNFVLCAVAAVVARLAIAHYVATTSDSGVLSTANAPLYILIPFLFALVNLMLGVFNLLPVPPLDGSAVIERMLPARHLPIWYRVRPYGLVALLVAVVAVPGALQAIIDPFQNALIDFVAT